MDVYKAYMLLTHIGNMVIDTSVKRYKEKRDKPRHIYEIKGQDRNNSYVVWITCPFKNLGLARALEKSRVYRVWVKPNAGGEQ